MSKKPRQSFDESGDISSDGVNEQENQESLENIDEQEVKVEKLHELQPDNLPNENILAIADTSTAVTFITVDARKIKVEK